MRNTKKNREQFNLILDKPFDMNDLPKNPQTAAEKVAVFCCSLFTLNPNVPRRTIPKTSQTVYGVQIISNRDFNIREMLPKGEGAQDSFDRDINFCQIDLDEAFDNW